MAQLTVQYNAGQPNRNELEYTVQQTMLDMGLSRRQPTHVPLPTQHLRQARKHRNWTVESVEESYLVR